MGTDEARGNPAACPAAEGDGRSGLPWVIVITGVALLLRAAAGWMHGVHIDRDASAFIYPALSLLDGDLAAWFYLHTKPPVFSALAAIPIGLGVDYVLAIRAISILAGVWMLHPAWLIMRRIGRHKTLLLALAVIALARLEVKNSGRTLSDTTYACIMLYVFHLALIRGLIDGKWWGFVAGGVLGGVAFLTRSEAIIYVPLIPLLALLGAVRRRLRWRTACTAAAFPALAAAVIAPQVVLLSLAEGRFTLRRNVGQFMAAGAGLTEHDAAVEGSGMSTSEALSRGYGQILGAWALHFGKYVWDKTPRSLGYVGAVFLVAGLVACRRRIIRWGPLGLTLLMFLWTILAMSFLRPHARLLTTVLVFLAWPVGAGMVWLTDWLIRINPARLSAPDRARPWLIALMLAIFVAPTLASTLGRDRHEGHDLLAAAKIIRRDRTGAARVTVGTRFGLIPLRVRAGHVPVSFHWQMTVDEFEGFLRRKGIDYFVMSELKLAEMCPQLDPRHPPGYMTLVDTAASHPRAHEARLLYVFRIRPGEGRN